jgi:hypothetical protein
MGVNGNGLHNDCHAAAFGGFDGIATFIVH